MLSFLGEQDERRWIEDDLQVSRLSKAIGYVAFGWVLLMAIVPFLSSVQKNAAGQVIWPVFDLKYADGFDLFLGALGLSFVGAVGGIVSGMFSVRDSTTSLLDYRTSVKRMTLKPLVGAVAALTLYFFLGANVISGVAVTSAGTYIVAAFLAGFSSGTSSASSSAASRTPRHAPRTPRPRHPAEPSRRAAAVLSASCLPSSAAQCRPFQECHSAAYEPPAATSSSCEPSSAILPSSTTATRSASWAENSRCAIAITVRPVEHGGQRPLQVAGRPRVDQRGRLVEHQRVRVGEHQPGQRELLGLGRGRAARPPEPTHGVQPVGQRVHPVEGVDGVQRRPHLVVGGARRRGQREVVAQRADEDVVLLGDQRDVAAQVVQRQLDQPDAADGDRAGARRVDAGEQPAQRRLARAGRADHGEPLARRDVQVDAVQHVAPLDVGEAHVVGVELLVHRLARR